MTVLEWERRSVLPEMLSTLNIVAVSLQILLAFLFDEVKLNRKTLTENIRSVSVFLLSVKTQKVCQYVHVGNLKWIYKLQSVSLMELLVASCLLG